MLGLGFHLEGVVIPQFVRVRSSVAVRCCGGSVTAGAEKCAGLIMDREKPLGLFGRFEPTHNLLSLSGWSMGALGSIIQAFVAAMVCAWSAYLDRLYVTAQLVHCPAGHCFAMPERG